MYNELRNNYINNDIICKNIKKELQNILQNVKNIDKLGKKINTLEYDKAVVKLMQGINKLQSRNLEDFKN